MNTVSLQILQRDVRYPTDIPDEILLSYQMCFPSLEVSILCWKEVEQYIFYDWWPPRATRLPLHFNDVMIISGGYGAVATTVTGSLQHSRTP
jgi:hypothetical protein